MLFVSMCEILQQKAYGEFLVHFDPNCESSSACPGAHAEALACAYGFFFLGGLIFLGLDWLAHRYAHAVYYMFGARFLR